MSRIRLGGIKVFENRAYLCSSCRRGGDTLGSICSTLASGRINLGLLVHMTSGGQNESITGACARNAECFSGFIQWNPPQGECTTEEIEGDVCRISVFPHDQRPEVTASLVRVLDVGGIRPHGFASSPSAVTVVVSTPDFDSAMERLFDSFSFPDCGSYREWRTGRRMDEHLLSEVRCSYSEQIITIYGFASQTGLKLWNVSLPVGMTRDFGAFLSNLGELGLKLPFLVSNSAPREESIHFSFALMESQQVNAEQAFYRHLPGRDISCRGPVSVLFLHGPHFGDRYGIANALVSALRDARIPILALSCAVSSISAVIPGNDLNKAIEVLNSRFQTPKR